MAPKHKSSDAGNLDMPKTSYNVLPLSEKVKVLELMKKKKSYVEVSEIYSKNKSIHSIVKKKKCASFAIALKTAKITARVDDKCSVKVEKALDLWMEENIESLVSDV